MSHKQAEDQTPNEDQVLIDRVDAMMDIKRTDAAQISPLSPASGRTATAESNATQPTAAGQPIDIFKGLNTAPPVEAVEDIPSVDQDEPTADIDTASDVEITEAPQEKNEPSSAPELPQDTEETTTPVLPVDPVPAPKKLAETVKKSQSHEDSLHDDVIKVGNVSPDVRPAPKGTQKSTLKISVLDDAETDKAVDEIVIAEGDALLAAEDVAATVASPIKKPKKGLGKLGELFE